MVRTIVRVFLTVWVLAAAGQAAFAEKRVALVIGNSNYEIAGTLANPKNDADDVADSLKRLHFEVTKGLDLTTAQFDKAVDAFTAAAEDADVALFFFSGHGVQIDKRGYLAPVNVKIESESSALRELVAIQEIVSRTENAAKVSVILLDACRDSPLHERLRRIARDKNRGLVPLKGLPPVSVVGSNTLIVYATVPGETASDGHGRNSPFTGSLLKHIETPGLEVELMFKRVTADVLKETGGQQQPERLSRLQSELVFLGSQQAVVPKPLSEAAQAWAEIKDLQKPSVFEAFRKQYGQTNPFYDSLALQRIEELKRAQVAVISQPKQVPTPQKEAEEACQDGLLVSVSQASAQPCIKPGSGQSFKDCSDCPEMVVVPAGNFSMGSPENEPDRLGDEGPQHSVTIEQPFAVGQFSITVSEYMSCVKAGGCKPPEWDEPGSSYNVKTGSNDHYNKLGGALTGDRYPIVGVSWDDAQAYVTWLSAETGKTYRLLSEAEFEYAARAGTTTPFWWGKLISTSQANYNGNYTYAGSAKGEYKMKPVPVKSFKRNPWGLYQVHGNVWTWTQDCWIDNYEGANANGSASIGDCNVHSITAAVPGSTIPGTSAQPGA